MLRLSEVKLPLEHVESDLEAAVLSHLAQIGVKADGLVGYTVFRRAHDARKRSDIKLTYIIDIEVKDEERARQRMAGKPQWSIAPDMQYRFVARAPRAAPRVRWWWAWGRAACWPGCCWRRWASAPSSRSGARKRERTKDTFGLWRQGVLNPESNVQFGEGGAGTFSDGKLYSQIKDPKHYGRKVLEEFVKAGAPDDILQGAAAHWHLPPSQHGGKDACRDPRTGRRDPLQHARGRPRHRRRQAARRQALHRRLPALRAPRAGRRPQRARHLRDAACARRVHGGCRSRSASASSIRRA